MIWHRSTRSPATPLNQDVSNLETVKKVKNKHQNLTLVLKKSLKSEKNKILDATCKQPHPMLQ